MSNLNQCYFVGRLGRDPETRYMQNGEPVCNFSIAVNWKGKDKEGVEWVNVVAFGKLADICAEYLHKGKQVLISGSMRTRKWQDKEGRERQTTEIVADKMEMFGSASDGERFSAPENPPQPAPQPAPQPQSAPPPQAGDDDDIPF